MVNFPNVWNVNYMYPSVRQEKILDQAVRALDCAEDEGAVRYRHKLSLACISHLSRLAVDRRLSSIRDSAPSRPPTKRSNTGGGGREEIRPPVCYQRTGLLTLMRVEAALRARSNSLGPTSVKEMILVYKRVQGGFAGA